MIEATIIAEQRGHIGRVEEEEEEDIENEQLRAAFLKRMKRFEMVTIHVFNHQSRQIGQRLERSSPLKASSMSFIITGCLFTSGNWTKTFFSRSTCFFKPTFVLFLVITLIHRENRYRSRFHHLHLFLIWNHAHLCYCSLSIAIRSRFIAILKEKRK